MDSLSPQPSSSRAPTPTTPLLPPNPTSKLPPARALKSIPAVLLGCLLSILDGVSYGMIIFPGTGVFVNLGPMGVSMFFLSTTLAQVVYTCGGSGFAGATGSMMVEVVPFFHILATSIQSQIGESNPKQVIATTLAAFALSSTLTGLTFLLLGFLKLGSLIGFFPRHILVGCIGGVGVFLLQTGLTVSMRIADDALHADLPTLTLIFLNPQKLVLWLVPLLLALGFKAIMMKSKNSSALVFPIYFLMMPVIFYIVAVGMLGVPISDLRKAGWIFDMGNAESEAWYKFYDYWDFGAIQFRVLWDTLPTQFALLFFNILHPPLNVPALSISLDEDHIDTDKELVAHGYSNLLSASLGTVPNYLVYVNTLLFYRVGGGTRTAGLMLGAMNAVLLVIGTAPIAFIPVMVVGALIIVLGIDLVKEALWDTRNRTTRTEYITIVGIVVVMTVWDFVTGVLCGIVASCETAMSTVRRPSVQRAYLREVSKQTTILRLQGFLFFGTISHVEHTIRGILDAPAWHTNPISFLIMDLTLVAGVDMSSSEAFVRMRRFLALKGVTMVFCGFKKDEGVACALDSVGVLGAGGVVYFERFCDALEWTENAYLGAWYSGKKYESSSAAWAFSGRHNYNPGYERDRNERLSVSLSSFATPRTSYLRDVGNRTIGTEPYETTSSEQQQQQQHQQQQHPTEPLNTLIKAFSSFNDIEDIDFLLMSKYLERLSLPANHVLWVQGAVPDGLYIVESGVLRASYKFADHLQQVEESMVPGTVAGELSALSALPRNATVVVDAHGEAVVWRLSMQSLERLEVEDHRLARKFLRLVVKAAKIDHDILISALASRQYHDQM